MKLKSYAETQLEKGAVPPEPKVKSGVACTDFVVEEQLVDEKYRETKGKDKGIIKIRKVKKKVKTKKPCPGEMLYYLPTKQHPEYPNLKKAACSKCGWRGWV